MYAFRSQFLLIAFASMLFTGCESLRMFDPNDSDTFKNFPYIVNVQSTYRDQKTGQAITLSGAGTVVKIRRDHYVLTASHLSQGQSLKIKTMDNRALKPIGNIRLADNDSDMELIRIENPKLDVRFSWDYDFEMFTDYADGFPRAIRGDILYDPEFFPVLQVARNAFVPVTKWISCIPEHWTSENADQHHFIRLNITSEHFSAYARVAPGLSGSPLLSRRIKYGGSFGSTELEFDTTVISGVTQQYSRFFKRSQFSTYSQIKNLVKRLRELESERKWGDSDKPRLTSTKWLVRNGLTYRQYNENSYEANHSVAGGGDLGVAGRGGYGDGGRGGYGDGGRGGYGDGTENDRQLRLVIGQYTRLKEHKDHMVSEFGAVPESSISLPIGVPRWKGHQRALMPIHPHDFHSRDHFAVEYINFCSDESLRSGENPWVKFGLRAGMNWDGKEVLVLKLRRGSLEREPKIYSRDLFIAANHTAYQFVRRNNIDQEKYDLFSERELNFLWLLRNRAEYDRSRPREYESLGDCEYEVKDEDVRTAYFTTYERTESGRSILFQFSVDQTGSINGSDAFYPINTVSGAGFRKFILDVSGLFFTDLGEVTLPRPEEKSYRGETEAEVIHREGSGAFIRYRDIADKGGEEKTLQCIEKE